MKKILLSLLIMIIAVPAFAKDPKETVEYYYNKGSITKKEIKEIEKKYKNEEAAVKKQAEIIRNNFLKAVFE